jgi:uncharacterized protein YbcI
MGDTEEPDGPLSPTLGELMQAIADAVVRSHRRHVGRGAARAQALYQNDVVVVVMRNALTQAEITLVGVGREEAVLALRRQLQHAMKAEMVSAVERLTGRTVEACMSTNSVAPDMVTEVFVLDGPVTQDADSRSARVASRGSPRKSRKERVFPEEW